MQSSYALGLFFIFLVSVIWTVASIVIQYIYQEYEFNSPFLLTYIGTSLFTVLLPVRLAWERRQRLWCRSTLMYNSACRACCYHRYGSPFDEETTQRQREKDQQDELELQIIPWKTRTTALTNDIIENLPLARSPSSTPSSTSPPSSTSSLASESNAITDIGETMHSDSSYCYKRSKHTLAPSLGDSSSSLDSDRLNSKCNDEFNPLDLLSHQQHLQMALKIAPIWFLANWAYNSSLAYTSITSSTVLSSTGSLFTFIFAIASGDEKFTRLKLVGVLLGVLGSLLTGLHDVNANTNNSDQSWSNENLEMYFNNSASTTTSSNQAAGHLGTPPRTHDHSQSDPFGSNQVFGDCIGLLSAAGYGTYTVLIRVLCPRDERRMSMQLLLGYIGLLNAVILLPFCVHILFSPYAVPISSALNKQDIDNEFATESEANDNAAVIDSTTTPSSVTVTTTADQLSWVVFGYLVVTGLLDNVLSDYLWARAVILTSATVATVGLGLTIPLAFISDSMLGNNQVAPSMQSISGACSVLVGFVFVNLYNDDANGNDSYINDRDGNGKKQSRTSIEHCSSGVGISSLCQ